MLRFETAGESHGECLVATLTGLPAGIPISLEAVNRELWRRQQGYGRGGRMKIETDRAEIVAGVRLERAATWDELVALSLKDEVLLGCVDAEAEARMKAVVDEAYRTGDTVGGVFEVVAHGLPIGLGSHVTWDSRLDGRIAQAIISMQAVKGVEVGFAAEGAASFGSKVQDTIHYDREEHAFFRGANRAGGLEGGMTNGQDVLVRGFLKPISTLRRPLESVDLETRESSAAAYERSDVCVVPAAGVIGEAMVAIVRTAAMLEKFGGDSLEETRRNYPGYLEQVRNF